MAESTASSQNLFYQYPRQRRTLIQRMRSLLHPRVFISYRHGIAPREVETFADNLRQQHGLHNVFFDMASLQVGDHLPQKIGRAIKRCDAFVLMVGQGTLDRVHDDADWVRHEIRLALRRYKRKHCAFIPLLLGNTRMPQPHELPPDIREMASIMAKPYGHDARHLPLADITKAARRKRQGFYVRSSGIVALIALFTVFLTQGIPVLHSPALHFSTTSDVVAGNSTSTLRAVCPPGTVVINGGYRLDDQQFPDRLIPEASFPSDDHSWTVRVANSNSVNESIAVHVTATCLSDSGLATEIKQSDGATDNGHGAIRCPAAMVVTGGGYNFTGSAPGTVTVTTSTFADYSEAHGMGTPNGWAVTTTDTTPGATQVVYAICAEASAATTIGTAADVTVTSGKTKDASVTCPSSQTVGVTFTKMGANPQNLVVAAAEPASDGHSWHLTFNNADIIADQHVRAWPVCAAFKHTVTMFHQFKVTLPW